MEWYEIAIVLVTISLFIAGMYQASLIRSNVRLSQRLVLSFTLDFYRNRLNLNCQNIGNGLAKNIEFVVKTEGEQSLESELKITRNGLAREDSFLINNWQKSNWTGVPGYYDFECEISGTCKDIFGDEHEYHEKLHFDSK